MEDKQKICDLFLVTLQNTRNLFDLNELKYDSDKETVTAIFANGGTKVINVAMDSGTSMIKDIILHVV